MEQWPGCTSRTKRLGPICHIDNGVGLSNCSPRSPRCFYQIQRREKCMPVCQRMCHIHVRLNGPSSLLFHLLEAKQDCSHTFLYILSHSTNWALRVNFHRFGTWGDCIHSIIDILKGFQSNNVAHDLGPRVLLYCTCSGCLLSSIDSWAAMSLPSNPRFLPCLASLLSS